MTKLAPNSNSFDQIRAIVWEDNRLKLLDQRLLPFETRYIELHHAPEVAQAITDMVVRGAPAIGITAAYGIVLAAREHYQTSPSQWRQTIMVDLQTLLDARPTAINLKWAVESMRSLFDTVEGDPAPALLHEAQSLHTADIKANHRMGELGAALIEAGSGVVTHCNTGSLATGGYGTALGVIRCAYAADRINTIYVDETRPWLQGARLTAWELMQDGLPATLIVDSASARLMQLGQIQWAIVGADRIAANGDTANKIGTYALAVAARYHGVKFMVVAPTSSIDMASVTGDEIPIENRSDAEILAFGGHPIAASGVKVWNSSFDVTPAELIDAIVTEKGVVSKPNSAKLATLFDR